MSDRLKLAREIARFIEIPRERGGGKVQFTEEQLVVMRGGMTAEEKKGRRPKPTPHFIQPSSRALSTAA